MSEKELYRRLGRAVADRREAIGLTQDQLANQLGLSRASVANIENGRQRIMVHQLFGLVNALKLESILDLVPSKWTFEGIATRIKVSGGVTLKPEQQSKVDNLLTALTVAPRRKRSS